MNNAEQHSDFPSSSDHYQDASGAKYFEWQDKIGKVSGKIEAEKFQDYIRREHSVLDFGCGGGYALLNLYCSRKVGVEVNPTARASAERLGIECYDSLHWVEDGSFDVIISNHALEHVPFPIDVLRSVRQKLKPSGVFLLCVPIDDWRSERKYDPNDINHHLNTWTPQLLGNSLVEAGFKPAEFSIRILNHAWFRHIAPMHERMPKLLFDFLCYLCAVVIKRRQLFVIARKLTIA